MIQTDGTWRGRADTYDADTVAAIVAATTCDDLDAAYQALLARRGYPPGWENWPPGWRGGYSEREYQRPDRWEREWHFAAPAIRRHFGKPRI
jgi:hypothetical protein